jgi:hypothetical protein
MVTKTGMLSDSEPPETLSDVKVRPMRHRLFIASIAALALVIVITIAVMLSAALKGSVGPSGILALLIFGGVALVASLATTEVIPWGKRDLFHWQQPKVLGAVGTAIILAAGALFSLLPLLQSSSVVESKPRSIERGVYAVKDEVEALAKKVMQDADEIAPIRHRISGFWGLIGSSCARGFRMVLNDDSLTINSRGEPLGAAPYFSEATVITAKGNVLESRGLSGEGKGISSTFTLTGNAKIGTLSWKDQSGDFPPTELEWCGA